MIYEEDLTVTGGRARLSVDVEDSSWFRPLTAAGFKAENISKYVQTHVVFSPDEEQDPEILAVTGERGELLQGPAVKKAGDSSIFLAEKVLIIPFKQ